MFYLLGEELGLDGEKGLCRVLLVFETLSGIVFDAVQEDY